jgi:glycopeptide antibiotics resistance protein
MLQGPVPLEISRALIVAWLLPAAAMLVALIAVRDARPTTYAKTLTVLRWMLIAYLLGAIILTLWPLDFAFDLDRVDDGNWTPLKGSLGFLISDNSLQNELGGRDVLANVVLFTPFGLLLPFAFYSSRGILVSALIIALLAFGLEFTQGLLIAERTIDVDDAISGFVGGIVALALASLLRPIAHRKA